MARRAPHQHQHQHHKHRHTPATSSPAFAQRITYVEVVDGDVEDETDVVLVDVLVLDDVVVHALALSSISCIGL